MPSNTPLLTLAIPTYNRSDILERLMKVLAVELQGETRVELLISDNASPDGTPSVVTKYRNSGLVTRAIRNEENIGPDRNILQCFEEAAGKYVWIFSDDDIPAPGAIGRLLDTLSSQEGIRLGEELEAIRSTETIANIAALSRNQISS